MKNNEKYERYKLYADRSGFRPMNKENFFKHKPSIMFDRITVHPFIRDCEILRFMLGNEYESVVNTYDFCGYDTMIVPYWGYVDKYVKEAVEKGAELIPLESYDDGTVWNAGKKNETSIKKYLNDLDYGLFALYDQNAIIHFADKFFFLSNFYLCDVVFDGVKYKTSEAAFQAQKCEDKQKRLEFTQLTPGEAKKLGKTVKLREDWEEVKVDIMREVVKAKFDQHPELKEKLIATGDRCLIEVNVWKDKFWGVSCGKGKNMLGRILMDLRKAYKEE